MANTPYPQSYYAASANPVPPRPALQGEVETDVCIIGAGYTGLSSALFLLENGFKVSIVEAAKVGFGASGRNGGQIVNSYSRDIDVIERTVGPKQAQLLGQMAAGHFQHRLQLGELGRPQPQTPAEGRQIRLHQRTQPTEVSEQMARQIHGAFTGNPGTKEDCQQLGVRKTRRTLLQQLLARPLRRWPIANTHNTSLVCGRRCSIAVAVIS